MERSFRDSMGWLHTWAGVVLGGVLFAIFWMGTLSVFDREIDRWMMPMTRLAIPASPVPFDALRPTIAEAAAVRSPFWSAVLPTAREPTIRVAWRGSGGLVQRHLDPATGRALPDAGTWAGTRFIFPFHVDLHIHAWTVGRWIVGLAGMAMMLLCISGVVIHRRLFADFFTFRAQARPGRLLLDLHNMAGALGLPFYVAISLSGVIIFYTTFFPGTWRTAYHGDNQAYGREAFDIYSRPKAGKPGELASLDGMVAEARRSWDGAPARSIIVRHPGDAAAFVQVVRSADDGVVAAIDTVSFDGTDGSVLHRRVGSPPMLTAQRFLVGLHWIQFRHWTLRWLYFALGLGGCVLIASGYLFWLESRRKRHEQLGLRGVRVVDGLAVGGVTGIVAATFAFFLVNRLLPPGATVLGAERFAVEIWTFYLVWLAAFVHAWALPARAWRDQCLVIAVLAVTAVLSNWLTTGDHLLHSVRARHLWPVAGIDIALLAGAGLATLAARSPGRRASRPAVARSIVRTASQGGSS